MKKKLIILIGVCLVILIGGIIVDRVLNKSNLIEISYKEVMEKIENKDTFILVVSQTECTHCLAYKPKLDKVAKEYNLDVYVIEVDLISEEEDVELKKHFNYDGTPNTIFVKNGEETTGANRIIGSASEKKIIAKLKSNGYID